MLTRLLGLDEGPITSVEPYLRVTWPRVVILLLVLLAVGYAALLYRREKLLSPWRRGVLAALRSLLYVIVIVLLLEPTLAAEMEVKLRRNVLVLFDVSASMGIVDARKGPAQLEPAAHALGDVPFGQRLPMDPKVRRRAASASRLDLAKALMTNRQLDLAGKLGEDYNLRYFAFGEELLPTKGKGRDLGEIVSQLEAADNHTRLGTAVAEAIGRFGGQPIAAVVLLTDGASNDGLEPLEVARRLKDQTIPLLAVGLGQPHPPDVKLRGPLVADTVFVNDKVPVRVQISSAGFDGQVATITASLDGKPRDSRRVLLDGRTRYVELEVEPTAKTDAASLAVSVTELPGEISVANNTVAKTVRVIDEKIKVIYVEGKPRWEYRYLRRVLLRDHRLDVKFLMTEGDRDLATYTEENVLEFPVEAGKAFDFDLVILGDVPASYFSGPQMKRIEELVRKRKGSLLMLCGSAYNPVSYIGTPVEALLPVKLNPAGYRKVDDGVHPKVADAGHRSALATLDVPEARNDSVWSQVKPMDTLPAIDAVKGGAVVLVELSERRMSGEPYPLIAWQRYGSGKTMLVGTDQLWRLRFKRGDEYHARLWGQAIQFLTLSRLLGGNRRISVETERNQYRQGERVAVTVNAVDEAYEPVKAARYTVELRRLGAPGPPAKLELQPTPGLPGMFQGYFNPDEPGRYEVRTETRDPKLANTAAFDVTPSTLEQREPAMQEQMLRQMADLSGGKYFALANVAQLPGAIAGEERTVTIRRERELWDLWVFFVAALLLAGTEWMLRRRYDLI